MSHPAARCAYIGLGSNLDQPERRIVQAIAEIDNLRDTRIVRRSSLYRSAPVGYTEQPDFINAVVSVETMLSPVQLLNQLLAIEQRHGRRREFANAPRTLDLDLLLYDDWQLNAPGLRIPHPRMLQRGFVLRPLHEIDPALVIPGAGPLKGYLDQCDDQNVQLVP
jgi:2-amino-4-hydroxy-6-hydroxymethyldihydropteridine diphosphokinase